MADRQGVLAGKTGKGTRSWYFSSKWKEIPGLDNFSLGSNEPTAQTYPAFEGSFAEVGSPEVADVSWDIVSFMPHHPAWKYLDEKRESQDSVQFRVETNEVAKFTPQSTATVEIAKDTGVVTFGGTGLGSAATDLGEVARGMCFKLGSDLHTIESVSDDDIPVFVCEPPAEDVSAASYSVVFPIMRFAFTGIVKASFGVDISREAPMSSRFIVTPTTIVKLPSIQTTLTE